MLKPNIFAIGNIDSVKSITLDNYPPEAWTWLSGKPDGQTVDYYARVAAVFAAVNLISQATAAMPFALVDTRTGEDYDTSDKWENKVGFMPYPRELFRLLRQSVTMTNAGYLFMEGNRLERQLRYIVPSSITPNFSAGKAENGYTDAGLISFTRRAGNGSRDYPATGKDARIIYFWRRDYSTEFLPSDNTEYRAMENAAGLLYSMDFWSRNYFEKGGVKPTLVAIKGQVNEQTKKDVESAWTKFVTGINKLRAKIINAEAMEVKPFGDGVGDLKDSQVYRQALENICIALHIPISMLLSNAANFATAQVDTRNFYEQTIIPVCDGMADAFNEQLFRPMGLMLQFRPNQTEAGTEDEVQRAGAYAQYVSTGMKPSTAAQVVGLELPPGMTYSDLDPAPQSPAPTTTEQTQPEAAPAETMAGVTKFTPSIEHIREMKVWQDIAFRKHKRGDALDFAFELRSLPEWVGTEISTRLAHAADVDDIRAAFDVEQWGETVTDELEYKAPPEGHPFYGNQHVSFSGGGGAETVGENYQQKDLDDLRRSVEMLPGNGDKISMISETRGRIKDSIAKNKAKLADLRERLKQVRGIASQEQAGKEYIENVLSAIQRDEYQITLLNELEKDYKKSTEIITLAASITALADAMKAAPTYTPPAAVRESAKRGLELREKYGKGGLTTQEAGAQGIGSGVARASNLANGDNIPLETIRRMSAFFSRHEKNKSGGEDDAGYIAWQLWGGDAGRDWVNSILRDVEAEK